MAARRQRYTGPHDDCNVEGIHDHGSYAYMPSLSPSISTEEVDRVLSQMERDFSVGAQLEKVGGETSRINVRCRGALDAITEIRTKLGIPNAE